MATVLVQWNHTGDEDNFRLYKVHRANLDGALTTGLLVESAAGTTGMDPGLVDGTGLVEVPKDDTQYPDDVPAGIEHVYYSLRAANAAGNSAPASQSADATKDFLYVNVVH